MIAKIHDVYDAQDVLVLLAKEADEIAKESKKVAKIAKETVLKLPPKIAQKM